MEKRNIYASPKIVNDINECIFYHTVELPGIGIVEGSWDLREGIHEYLGNVNFKGKRVLDVGTASGFLCFFMEKQGAEVICFDLSKEYDWDIVPFAKWKERQHIANDRKTIIDKLNNSYWFAHRLYNSLAKVVYGSVYEIPNQIGPVDIVVYGSILLHLRDPFFALQNGLKLARETVIVADALRGQPVKFNEPYMQFLPDPKTIEPKDTWWDIRPELVIRMIGVLGFEDTRISQHYQKYNGKSNLLYTVVGNRTTEFSPPE
jgi:SAM-dependent methyltransferase